ncbi:MAG: tetratricopeptide repeat protein [Oligoflexia bacterium]|nr:tetratricopeptide repeat protein [Oligoflexia bacterium]
MKTKHEQNSNDKNTSTSDSRGKIPSQIQNQIQAQTQAQAHAQAHKLKTKHQEDIRVFVLKHWRAVSAAIALVIITAFSYGMISSHLKQKASDQANTIYEFKSNTLTQFKQDKLSKDEFMKKWNELSTSCGKNEQLFFVAVDVLEYLLPKKDFTTAQTIAAPLLDRFRSNTFIQYFLSQYLAVIYEDTGDNKKAIEVLERLIKSNSKILEAKVYFDLGRLYLQSGQKDKAKSNLQYVVDKFPSTNLVKIAKLYLKQI